MTHCTMNKCSTTELHLNPDLVTTMTSMISEKSSYFKSILKVSGSNDMLLSVISEKLYVKSILKVSGSNK